MPQPITGRGGYLVPPIDPKNTNVIEDVEILLPVNFVEFHSSVSDEKPRMSQPIRSRGGHLFFQFAGKHNLGRRVNHNNGSICKSLFLCGIISYLLLSYIGKLYINT